MYSRILCLLTLFILVGCESHQLVKIDKDVAFVATLNIQEQSITFLDQQGELLAEWSFDTLYTGGLLLNDDELLLYGHQLDEAALFSLSKGEVIHSYPTGIGTAGVAYVEQTNELWFSKSKENKLSIYDKDGKWKNDISVGLYPQSILAYDERVYVVNYKDTKLSVIDIQSKQVKETVVIPKSSTGLLVFNEKLYIGGHGYGLDTQNFLTVLSLTDLSQSKTVNAGTMPVQIAEVQDEYFVVSHGSNELHHYNKEDELLYSMEVGANPFAINKTKEMIVVAGYDSSKVYWIDPESMTVEKESNVGEGPFEMFVRE
ncbi:hypothetical protein Q75_04205 [Bacillus coahuilensis p1.1.43]|uniref:Lipoprotein n=1 Tax=Bacillus coahuilensis p1.1.43 TaxID=1150625 RepID=A0A147KAI7_9BACI|nr:hypothetical protein [Bacillus coahuilensis]KUP07713.1 hypothetical protein Q75_04205 [Bacillus coahuilensis p1.1.43]